MLVGAGHSPAGPLRQRGPPPARMPTSTRLCQLPKPLRALRTPIKHFLDALSPPCSYAEAFVPRDTQGGSDGATGQLRAALQLLWRAAGATAAATLRAPGAAAGAVAGVCRPVSGASPLPEAPR